MDIKFKTQTFENNKLINYYKNLYHLGLIDLNNLKITNKNNHDSNNSLEYLIKLNLKELSLNKNSLVLNNNSLIDLDEFDVFCFDIDHTIAIYNNNNLAELMWNSFTEYLYKYRNYPDIRSNKDNLNNNENNLFINLFKEKEKFYSLDIILDKKTGLALKLNSNKKITKAYYGYKELSNIEIDKIYKNGIFFEFDYTIKNNEYYRFISGWYDYCCISIYLFYIEIFEYYINKNLLINKDLNNFLSNDTITLINNSNYIIKDNNNLSINYSKIINDIMSALVYNYCNFDTVTKDIYKCKTFNDSMFFKEIFNNPKKYLCNKNNSLNRSLLENLKMKNKNIVFITNSTFEFSKLILSNSIGEDYLDFCDLIVYFANKPSFFKNELTNYYDIALENKNKNIINSDKVVSNSNVNEIRLGVLNPFNKTYFLDEENNKQCGEEVLFDFSFKDCQYQLFNKVKQNKQFILGNYQFVEWFYKYKCNKENNLKYLMIGDSILSDCYDANKLHSWRSMFVLSSLEYKKTSDNVNNLSKNFGVKWGKFLHFNEFDEIDHDKYIIFNTDKSNINNNLDKLNLSIDLIKKEKIMVIPHIEYIDYLSS